MATDAEQVRVIVVVRVTVISFIVLNSFFSSCHSDFGWVPPGINPGAAVLRCSPLGMQCNLD